MELDEFRASLDRWLDENADALAPESGALGTLDGQMAQLGKVKRLTYDAGWMRWGWPERVGGLGELPPNRACASHDRLELLPLIVGRYSVADDRRREAALRGEGETLEGNEAAGFTNARGEKLGALETR
jgi:alkylation response protein AidB-like acyl-CoA dehydrogenase